MNELIAFLKQNKIPFLENEPMRLHTTFKTGGNAALFMQPASLRQLQSLVRFLHQSKTAFFTLGNGSNLLVSDDGPQLPVVAVGQGLDAVELVDETTICAGAGASLVSVCCFARDHGLSGLEFAYGIPGSLGGAVFMNAGAYGGEMKDVVSQAFHLLPNGEAGSLAGEALGFGYRTSAYKQNGCLITGALIRLNPGNKEEIAASMREILQRRKDKQPLEYPSAGSVFKRPPGYFAGALIEQSGLKGKQIGGAMVSEKHAGFIINVGGATTADVKALIEFCRQTVQDRFGVLLETEIQMVGR